MQISELVTQIHANYVLNISIEIYFKIIFYVMGAGFSEKRFLRLKPPNVYFYYYNQTKDM